MGTWLLPEILALQIAPFQAISCCQAMLSALGGAGEHELRSEGRNTLLCLGYAVFHQQGFFYLHPPVTFVLLIISMSVIDLQDILGLQSARSELLTRHMGHWCEETSEQTGCKAATLHS